MSLLKRIFGREPQEPIIPPRDTPELKILADGPSLLGWGKDKEAFEQYKDRNGANHVWVHKVGGLPEDRESRLRELARQFGATRAWQTSYCIPDVKASYNIWDEGNNIVSAVEVDGKIITFTHKALADIIGEYNDKGWGEKEIPLPEELRKQCKKGFGGYDFTQAGRNQSRTVEQLLGGSLDIADQTGANVINVYKMSIGYDHTTFTLRFFYS
jgi:hypothetical protein